MRNSKRQMIMAMLRNPEGRNRAEIARHFDVGYQYVRNAEHYMDQYNTSWEDVTADPTAGRGVADATVAEPQAELGLWEETHRLR